MAKLIRINGFDVSNIKQFGYDTCHKIYLAENEEDKSELESLGYEMRDLATIVDTFNESCPLRFISTNSLKTIVNQFEDAKFEFDDGSIKTIEYDIEDDEDEGEVV